MLESTIRNTKIVGISTVVPKKSVSLKDDKSLYNGDEKKISRVIDSSGFLNRRISDGNVTALDLCERAASILLEEMEVAIDSIDAVVFVTYTPDYIMPSNASIIHKRLGMKTGCAIFDVSQGCAGYIYGLWLSGMMLSANLKRVLLLVGDTFTKFEDMFADHSAPVFGDAGSATLLDFDAQAPALSFSIGSDGAGYDAIICENLGFRNPPSQDKFNADGSYQYNSKMDGLRVFNFALERVPDCVKNTLSANEMVNEDIDYFIFHQANKYMVNTIASKLGISKDKVPMETLTHYGNQSCASIPGAICDRFGSELSSQSLTLLLCGFGVGLSWGGTVVELNHIYCSGIREY